MDINVYSVATPIVLAIVALVLTELTVRNALKGATPSRASWSLE